jgi:hypothetical protein
MKRIGLSPWLGWFDHTTNEEPHVDHPIAAEHFLDLGKRTVDDSRLSEGVTATGTIEVVWRIEQPKLVARLARLLRDIGLAEEIAQDAFPTVRGDLLEKLGRTAEARAEFLRAAELTRNGRERALLLARADSSGLRRGH